MIAVLVVLCAIHVGVGGLDVCLAKTEKSHLSDLRTQLKSFTKTIDDLEKGLQGKHFTGNGGCKKGWDRFGDYCYYFNKDKKTWYDAERYCREEGSSLVDINDDSENNFVMTKSKEANMQYAWTGAYDGDAGKWIWMSTFAPVKYFKWAPNEPNNKGGVVCLLMYPNLGGKWNDHSCQTPLNFVCKRHVSNGCPTTKN